MNNPAIVLLAAGQSRRLGQPKQLLPFINGSLLRWQCAQALSVNAQVSCVLGYQAPQMSKQINDLPVKLVVNQQWQQGLSSSIAQGINALDDQVEGVLLLLIDQWQITAEDLYLLINTWHNREQAIVAASCGSGGDKKIGPPVVFPRQYFQQLKAMTTGSGAKHLLELHRQQVVEVSLANAFIDLDTPQQLVVMQNYLAQLPKNQHAV